MEARLFANPRGPSSGPHVLRQRRRNFHSHLVNPISTDEYYKIQRLKDKILELLLIVNLYNSRGDDYIVDIGGVKKTVGQIKKEIDKLREIVKKLNSPLVGETKYGRRRKTRKKDKKNKY